MSWKHKCRLVGKGEEMEVCVSFLYLRLLTNGRCYSEGIVPLASSNSVQHDTGFLAYPLIAELKV